MKFWLWFISFIIIICVIIYLLIIKVNNKKILIFDNVLNEPILLTKINDRNLYSIYEINKYNNKDLKNITKNDYDSIIDKMDSNESLNDGGTKLYFSDKIANKNLYILSCNTLLGNNDIYILDKPSINYCRS